MAQTQQQQPELSEEAVLATLTALILSGLSAQEFATYSEALLGSFGIEAAAVREAVSLLHPHLPARAGDVLAEATSDQTRAAERFMLRTSLPRHAAYLMRSARRFGQGSSVSRERRFISQHLAAERARRDAGRNVDKAALRHGPMLSWIAVDDAATTYGCRAAHGGLFRFDRPPLIEGSIAYPGTPHGGSCRCHAGPPRLGHFELEVAG